MKDIKDYKEYNELFKDDLVVSVRELLKKIEYGFDIVDSPEHNKIIEYFNKFALHKKISEKEFKTW